MEPTLKELFQNNGATAAHITFLETPPRNIKTLKKFANLFDKREDVTAWHQALGGTEGSDADLLVALKQGWREADNVIKLALDQRSTGHGEEGYAPLPPATAPRSLNRNPSLHS